MNASSEHLTVSGQLTEKDVKRLTRLTRGGTVGPTAVYYAGVTAPIISASMALLSKSAFQLINLSTYWQWMLSAIIAAMSGIVWYLVFMRWAYRHQHGRSRETEVETRVTLTDHWVSIRRGPVETRLDWSAVNEIRDGKNHTLILFSGVDALIIPDTWFGNDKAAIKAFRNRLKQGKS